MATWQKNVPCRYFRIGSCHFESTCPYSHDLTQEHFQDEYSGFEEGDVYETDHLNYSDISDVQELSLGVEAIGLDPCEDPNCLEDLGPQTFIDGSQEFAGGVYPSSPTYILYAPMYPSTALSPGGVPLSPALSNPGTHVHQALSPVQHHMLSPAALSPNQSSSVQAATEFPHSQIYPTPEHSFTAADATLSPITSLSHAKLFDDAAEGATLVDPGNNLDQYKDNVPSVITYVDPLSSSSTGASIHPAGEEIAVSRLNPDQKEFVPKASGLSLDSATESFTLNPNQQEFVPTRKVVDPPVFVPLKKRGEESWSMPVPTNWAEAPEFVPCIKETKERSWAQVVNANVPPSQQGLAVTVSDSESELCPYYRLGECRYGVMCVYMHGDSCDYCGQNILHPNNELQRRSHLAECLMGHERDMEHSFAVAQSREKTCGICMEIVLDKPKGEARFGILPSCNHCFCLPCIRKWRQAKQFEHKIIRACPECRQTSDFICPSRFWVETPEEKDRLLTEYKKNLGLKECKYFNKGSGECPFGNKCFYRHADKDGRNIDVGPPKKPARRTNAEGNLSIVQRLVLYDFLEERDGQYILPMDFMELLDLYSDSDDWSDGETQ